ncbi:hypothetical protein NHG29_02350 [Aerococcaceae bacterium NML160702]|nr:hypothetical protein [Aerococcaceae bacterium NML180378]MCW6681709.1 hypothetical protein [Aerococcaceae bacterium NML160702]
MRRDTIVSALLGLSIIVSLMLSYFVLFDSQQLSRLINEADSRSTKQSVTPDTTRNSFYNKADLTIREVFYPNQLIVKKGKQLYDVNSQTVLQRVEQQLFTHRMELTEDKVVANPDSYRKLFEQDSLEMVFAKPFPITMLDHLMSIKTDGNLVFEFDRLIWLKGNRDYAYAINSRDQIYLPLRMNDEVASQLFAIVEESQSTWYTVDRLNVQNGVVYLPQVSSTLNVEYYMLERIPDTQFIGDVFPTTNFNILETHSSDIKKLNNYQVTLTLNNQTQMMSLDVSQPNQKVPKTSEQKLRASFSELRQYEYWDDGMRYDGTNDFVVKYRRYLNGVPIVSESATLDYAATIINLRPKARRDGYIYQMPTLLLHARLNAMVEPIQLMASHEIQSVIEATGMGLHDFTRIFIGYEWRSGMEQFQVAKLVPTWYVEHNNGLYTLEELQNGTLQREQQAVGIIGHNE